ncbi:MAG TPA: hypothetical protein VLG16_03725 [Candidatus Saccharimonadales bacterium]|nr:hypothetical protein [Candidatus Saccharimonadales bacterium]
MFKHKRIVEYSLLAIGLFLFLFVGIQAAAHAQNVTQGYQSDTSLQQGVIVQLVPSDATKVEPLSQTSETSMLGVVVAPNDAPVTITGDNTKTQTYVATYGQYNVLVSNQNGPIKAGDSVSISAIDGVGMKADADHEVIIGKAIQSFDGASNVQSTATLKTSGGSSKTVAIGRIQVNINVAHNPAYNPVTPQAGVPTILSRAAKIVTDKPVGAVRIYASLAILIVCIFIAGGVMYAGVRTGMTAIGRNPLAKKSIVHNLIEVTLGAIIIFLIGVIAVYLLLKI